jgi:hypothetical protein
MREPSYLVPGTGKFLKSDSAARSNAEGGTSHRRSEMYAT